MLRIITARTLAALYADIDEMAEERDQAAHTIARLKADLATTRRDVRSLADMRDELSRRLVAMTGECSTLRAVAADAVRHRDAVAAERDTYLTLADQAQRALAAAEEELGEEAYAELSFRMAEAKEQPLPAGTDDALAAALLAAFTRPEDGVQRCLAGRNVACECSGLDMNCTPDGP